MQTCASPKVNLMTHLCTEEHNICWTYYKQAEPTEIQRFKAPQDSRFANTTVHGIYATVPQNSSTAILWCTCHLHHCLATFYTIRIQEDTSFIHFDEYIQLPCPNDAAPNLTSGMGSLCILEGGLPIPHVHCNRGRVWGWSLANLPLGIVIFPMGSCLWTRFIWVKWWFWGRHLKCWQNKAKSMSSHVKLVQPCRCCMCCRIWYPFSWKRIQESLWLVKNGVPCKRIDTCCPCWWSNARGDNQSLPRFRYLVAKKSGSIFRRALRGRCSNDWRESWWPRIHPVWMDGEALS